MNRGTQSIRAVVPILAWNFVENKQIDIWDLLLTILLSSSSYDFAFMVLIFYLYQK